MTDLAVRQSPEVGRYTVTTNEVNPGLSREAFRVIFANIICINAARQLTLFFHYVQVK